MREKQRRSDISNAFEELHHLTSQLEEQPQGTEEESSVSGDKKKRRKSSMDGVDEAGGNTRLDVIGRALRLLRRLHRENEERKRIIASYEAREGAVGSHPNDNVILMVPSLTPIADEHPVARASYPHTYPQSYHPHHSSPVAASAAPPYYLLSPSNSHDPRSTGYGPPPPHHHHSSAVTYHSAGYGVPQHHPPPPPPPPPHPHNHPLHLGPPVSQPHHPMSGLSPPPPHHSQSPSGHPER
jgi:hypothetical protein